MMNNIVIEKNVIKKKKITGKKAIATSAIGYIILGLFGLVIVILLIIGFMNGSLDVVTKIFGD